MEQKEENTIPSKEKVPENKIEKVAKKPTPAPKTEIDEEVQNLW